MQRKTLVLGFVGLMGVVIALAYAAGKQSNRLSAEQTNFNGYQSENHAKRLTAQVWDATMNALTTWAKNHESRLQVHGSVPGHPNLTDDQTSFSNLLSTQNNNALTAQMRDGLVNKLTMVVTNHEMRLRAVENKPAVQNGSCVGEYQDGTTSEVRGKKVPRSEIECRRFSSGRIQDSVWESACRNSLVGDENSAENQRWPAPRETFVYVWFQKTTPFIANYKCLTRVGWSSSREIDFDSCYYECWGDFKNDSTYCETKQVPIKKSCSDFNETACKAKPGCTWNQ